MSPTPPASRSTDLEQVLVVGMQVAGVLDQYLRRIWRASLTSESLLTIDEASDALPGIDDARSWFEHQVEPAGEISGRAMYRWADVVAALDRTRSRFLDSTEPAIEGYEAAAALLNTSATTLRRMMRSDGLPDELRPKNKSAGVKNCRPWWTDAAECRAWYERLTRWLALPAPPPQRAPRRGKLRRGVPTHEGPVDFAAHARQLSEHGR